jgi:hypothetical protein
MQFGKVANDAKPEYDGLTRSRRRTSLLNQSEPEFGCWHNLAL